MAKTEFVLLLGVDDNLFTGCFGDSSKWKCCVVVEDNEGPHWKDVIAYFKRGGFVVYFGIIGEFAAPQMLSQVFGVQWSFSAYTTHVFELTEVGKQLFGDSVTEQQYSKANLLKVPKEDRIMVPKNDYATVAEFIQNECDSDDEDGHEQFAKRREILDAQVPLALHTASHGGRIAYLGFVNGDGNIPVIVRALCTGIKTSDA